MQIPNKPKLTKRQALLALLAAVPVWLNGTQQADKQALEYVVQTQPDEPYTLLVLNFKLRGAKVTPAFLSLRIDDVEQVRVSLADAIQILKG